MPIPGNGTQPNSTDTDTNNVEYSDVILTKGLFCGPIVPPPGCVLATHSFRGKALGECRGPYLLDHPT
jgi:hypothetical protein